MSSGLRQFGYLFHSLQRVSLPYSCTSCRLHHEQVATFRSLLEAMRWWRTNHDACRVAARCQWWSTVSVTSGKYHCIMETLQHSPMQTLATTPELQVVALPQER